MASKRDAKHIPPLFRNIDVNNIEELETSEIESLCTECEEMGTTRLLLTKIPLFQEVIIMSFQCQHCNYSNNEIQSGSPVKEEGVVYTISVTSSKELNRLIVKADSATLKIPELEFEIPPNTQKGSINTLEGFIQLSITELEKDQPARKNQHPQLAEQLDKFIRQLNSLLSVSQPFSVVIDDPTGNSFVENRLAPDRDPNLLVTRYCRTREQVAALGLAPATAQLQEAEEQEDEAVCSTEGSRDTSGTGEAVSKDEVLGFFTNCSNCNAPAETRMKLLDIPHFQQVIVMAFSCDACGHKTNEVKSGTGIREKGKKITLRITDPSDLSRDILKSDTASLSIPELEFDMQPGTLGGRFTTIEGLLVDIKEQLSTLNPFAVGDSASKNKLIHFVKKLDDVIKGKNIDVHVVLDDPAGNSYLQNVYAPEEDPEMTVEIYQRSDEQNDLLGITDMKTEDYETTNS